MGRGESWIDGGLASQLGPRCVDSSRSCFRCDDGVVGDCVGDVGRIGGCPSECWKMQVSLGWSQIGVMVL